MPLVGSPSEVQYNLRAADVVIPEGVKIIGLVFYGRRDYVKILECYLKKNLKDNGGLLDEVVFAVNTDDKRDLAYLEELLATHPNYSKYIINKHYHPWVGSWEAVSVPDNLYIKIDDDVIYIEDSTIPAIVKRLLDNPKYFAVSANVLNNPLLSWVHYNMGVDIPYWPELTLPNPFRRAAWRASELPSYNGASEGPGEFHINGSTPAPHKGHRWLPVRPPPGEDYDIAFTPVSTVTYDAFGPSLNNWAAAAQIHYSFLQHLEQGDIWRYKFDVWDYAYERLSINFFAIKGKDVMDTFPFPQEDDEDYLTVVRPKQLKRHVVVDGTGLASHYAFGAQYDAHGGKGLTWTDILSRYREYAKEMICLQP
ncbi:hypothetical protein OIDMADRAFT_172663 [Oidiodendron maius Zn]|uniref:Uncharacterized protein n=1 Tax=Oidiodendron maius (strain Zn) TaxID=913774 RepID=A0A0C3GSS6_OIDMZ|nr:hypothetical protein OIDMADRAFT_172663 [Oidiodendron maius Zn]